MKPLHPLLILFLTGTILSGNLQAQTTTVIGSESEGIVAGLNENGTIKNLKVHYSDGWQEVKFRTDEFSGPGFGSQVTLKQHTPGIPVYFVEIQGIYYQLAYKISESSLLLQVSLKNNNNKDFVPERLPLILGIDAFMDKYPQWNTLYFPTFLRCELTHFWGYFMTPLGKILGISCKDPVGSYTIEYRNQMYDHYVYTASLDLLQKPPVPDHHPAYKPLISGEERTWTIEIMAIDKLDQVKSTLAKSAEAPMLDLYNYTLEPDQVAEFSIFSPGPITMTVTNPAGKVYPVIVKGASQNGKYQSTFSETGEYGYYNVSVKAENGKTAMGRFYVRPKWSWYIQSARQEALRLTPRADLNGDADGYSCESYYGLLGFWLASKHFPDPAIDVKGDKILEKILARLFKEENGFYMSGNKERIQNGSFMLSVLVDKYLATDDMKTLEMAEKFASYLLSRQHAEGYYGGYGMHPYTSVLYVAKAIVELMEVEKPLGAKDPKWKDLYDKHYQSVKRSIDDLVKKKLDVKTEGGGTFEDGSVSCSATQIAMFALMQSDPAERQRYSDAALGFLNAHSCLTRLLSPDTRSNGSTIRWWEAWGDNKVDGQMTTSPHGWSGWRLYAVYYEYLLTGHEDLLEGVMNALGSCAQLMDWPSGRLRQAYVIDPHLAAFKRMPDPKKPDGQAVPYVYSEEYLETIGEWYGKCTVGDTYLDRVEWGWTGDQIPYEIFKAMEEFALNAAYVIERQDGSVKSYNCSCEKVGGSLIITPSENIVDRVHVNTKNPLKCQVRFAGKKPVSSTVNGMQWIN